MTSLTLLMLGSPCPPEGSWLPVFHQADAVLLVGMPAALRVQWVQFIKVPVVAFDDLMVTDGHIERQTFIEGVEAAATAASALYPMMVNGVAVSFALANVLASQMRMEAGFYRSLQQVSRNRRHVVVVAAARSPWLMAGLRRFLADPDNRLRFSYQARNGVVEPLALGMSKAAVADQARAFCHADDPAADAVRFRASGAQVVDKTVRPNDEKPVVVVVSSTKSLYMRHSVPVLRAVVERGVPVWAVAGPGCELGPLAEVVPEDRTLRVLPATEETEVGAEVLRAVVNRWVRLYLDHGGVESLLPLELIRTQKVLRQRIEEICAAALAIKTVFVRLKPRSVWLPTAHSSLEELAVSAAAADAIPCVTGLAALINEHPRNMPFIRTDVWMAGYGEQLVHAFQARSMPVDRFVKLTGGPHFDYLYRLDAGECRRELEANVGADLSGRRIIGIMTSRIDGAAEDAWLLPLARLVAARSDLALVLKPHPARLPEYALTREALGELDGTCVFWSSVEPGVAIAASDVVVTDKSAIAIEVAILRRPLVQVNPGAEVYDYNDFVDDGIAVGARDADSILAAVDSLAGGMAETMVAARTGFLRQYNFGDDGRAAERTANLLVEPVAPIGPYQSPFIGLPLPD
ncbi:MAG TPA: CDP-glycerol glycerophosphotransferase family protein [Magnetospirillum sp.]|nr:CDP-glycerol glycerophosphotransferase family protein [Magnetospirillum sp.]